jgi:hypothetical protein
LTEKRTAEAGAMRLAAVRFFCVSDYGSNINQFWKKCGEGDKGGIVRMCRGVEIAM